MGQVCRTTCHTTGVLILTLANQQLERQRPSLLQMEHIEAFQWLSTFLMLRPFNTVPHVVVINHKIILLLLHNCNFDTFMNRNINI